VVDALQRIGRDAQAHVAGERVRDEGDVDQVRQEAPLGLDVRVAHLVAHLGALGRQFAAPGHRKILFHPRHRQARLAAARGSKIASISRNCGRIGGDGHAVKVFGRCGPRSGAQAPCFDAVSSREPEIRASVQGRGRLRPKNTEVRTAELGRFPAT
jgi:hypothetical protein